MPDLNRYDEFAAILQRHTGQILAYLNALLLDWNDAEDVFQDACIVLWQKFDEFETGTNFLAWALRIAQFKARDFQKIRSRRDARWKPGLQTAMIDDLAGRDVKQFDDDFSRLSECMAKLTDGDRHLAEACYGEGVPVREIADRMGRSPQSVHNSLHRIRRTLLECVERLLNRETRERWEGRQ